MVYSSNLGRITLGAKWHRTVVLAIRMKEIKELSTFFHLLLQFLRVLSASSFCLLEAPDVDGAARRDLCFTAHRALYLDIIAEYDCECLVINNCREFQEDICSNNSKKLRDTERFPY